MDFREIELNSIAFGIIILLLIIKEIGYIWWLSVGLTCNYYHFLFI